MSSSDTTTTIRPTAAPGDPPPRSAALAQLGWTDERASAFAPYAADGLVPGRVTSASTSARATIDGGTVEVIVQRRHRREATSSADYPVVGDWLALERVPGAPDAAALRAILPRTTVLARADDAGDRSGTRSGRYAAAQVLAANVDVALLVSAAGRDLNPRRIERYLVTCRAGGVGAVVVLNKADLSTDLAGDLATLGRVASGAPIHALSALTGDGLDALAGHLGAGVTACLLGSSGVGKSTLTNALLGAERQAVRAARADDERGRHTTTARELFALRSGALLIDTPGLRAVGVWDDGSALDDVFSDVERLATGCRFRDCHHRGEPGCAVEQGVASGALDGRRVDAMRKLEREVAAYELRADVRASRSQERRLGRMYRQATRSPKRRGWET
jgi:ribosome biogenesis GTPase